MRQTVWFLRNAPVLTGLEGQIRHYRDGIATLARQLDTVLPATVRERIDQAEAQLVASGVPTSLAARLARLDTLSRAPDVILVATQTNKPIDVVARAFFGIGARLGVDRLAQRAGQVDVADYFDRLALGRSVEGVFATQRGIAVEILRDGNGKGDPLTAWTAAKGPVLARTERSMAEMIGAAEMLKDDLETRGPVRLSEVEAAQKEILALVRKLAEAGTIQLGGKGEEFV
jgi:glutamate dehydrogenase